MKKGAEKKSESEYCSMLNNLNIVTCIREILVSSDQYPLAIMAFICV